MSNTEQIPELRRSKAHFDILDGLRGVAALAVVVFHFMEWVQPDFSQNFIAHGFLAVDFFFCLSGFVIAYAYDDRVSKLGTWEFLKARFIRLHPLVFLGSVVGLLAYLFDPFGAAPALDAGKIALIFLLSVFMIPYPVMEERAFNLFGLNAPSWSLFWEYVINIAYVLFLVRLGRKALIVFTIAAAALLFYIGYTSRILIGGWNGETIWHGGARVAFSFAAGMLIFRSKWIIKNRIGFAGLSLLLFLAFLMPFHEDWNWITQPLVVILFFPLIVSLGAGSTLSPGFKAICKFSGNISYPLYMTHYVAIWMFGNYFTHHNPGKVELVAVIIGGTLFLVLIAYLAMTLFDIPVRRYLSAKWRK